MAGEGLFHHRGGRADIRGSNDLASPICTVVVRCRSALIPFFSGAVLTSETGGTERHHWAETEPPFRIVPSAEEISN